jgi:predicted ATP-grasp superfamily ATP-dependent carboligase
MIRCFGERGVCPCLILYGCSNNSYVLRSKYIQNYSLAKNANDAIQLLIDSFNFEKDKSIVISCCDEISYLLNKNYSILKEKFYFFNCGKNEIISKFMDKKVQGEYAKKEGLMVPFSIETNVDDINKIEITYPCIVKPISSINGGKNIKICNNSRDLFESIKHYKQNTKVLVQEYIKKDYEIVLLGLALGEEVFIPGLIHKHRDIQGSTTFATVESIDEINPDIIDSCKRLCKSFNYEGLFGIEMIKRGKDHFFIEMNLRNDATTYALSTAGINLPIAYYKYITNDNYIIEIQKKVNTINSIVEFNDCIHILKGQLSPLQWVKDLKGSCCKYFYNKEDIKPFYKKLKEFFAFFFYLAKMKLYKHQYKKEDYDSI